jgi:phosphoribosylformylglycinamidine cyclo-ligase
MGVGMVALVSPEDADRLIAQSRAAGVDAWVLGEVGTDDARAASADAVRGAKGVQGGAVFLSGDYAR